MKKLLTLLMIIPAIMVLLSGCESSLTGNNSPDTIDISNDWRLTFTDDENHKDLNYDDSTWKQVSLPGKLLKEKGKKTYWIRKKVIINENLEQSLLAFVSGKFWDSEKTYFNGYEIGSTGKEPPDFASEWNFYKYYVIPNKIINYGSENIIAIRVYSNYYTMINGKQYISEISTAKKITFYRKMMAEYIPFGISVFMLLFGIILGFQYVFYRTTKMYLHFLILAILWAITSTHYFLPHYSFISYNLRDNLYYALLSILGYAAYFFLEELLKEKFTFLRYALLVTVIIVASVCISATPDDPITGWRFSFYSVFSGFLSIVYAVLIIRALCHKNREAIVIAIGYFIFLITMVTDGLIISGLLYNDFYYNYIGFPAFILSIGAVLSWRNSFIAKQLDEYSKTLEKKVEERTIELSNKNDELEAAFQELEATNDHLTYANNELEQAHTIMSKDMKMAANVQRSFFPAKAPSSDEWEISYIFKPHSEVSGDIYDFYTINNKLLGVALMDVSGHGISSGLIAMIAKSVFFRAFQSMGIAKLGEIIEKANGELVQEIGDSDNYLTGIFLRFDENIVQYVNAGHPEIILWSENSKTALPVIGTALYKDGKDRLLGIRDLQGKYNTAEISMNIGDYLFAYSDCISETTNTDKIEYGINNIIDSITRSPKNSSQEILDYLINDLIKFSGKEKFSDDLTAILIKKIK